MRSLFSLVVLALFTGPAWAQNAEVQELAAVLDAWEKKTATLESFFALVKRTNVDKDLGARDEHRGFAMFTKADKKAGLQAILDLTKDGNQQVIEKYIITGNNLYEYAQVNKALRVHPMPKDQPGGGQRDAFLTFLFGMDVQQAKGRFKMHPDQHDENYHLILIEPLRAADKSDFTLARIALTKKTLILAEFWYRQPNRTEVTWRVTDPQLNVNIPSKHFTPGVPDGWRLEKTPAAAPRPATLP
jgi:TIGR03009 family protein